MIFKNFKDSKLIESSKHKKHNQIWTKITTPQWWWVIKTKEDERKKKKEGVLAFFFLSSFFVCFLTNSSIEVW